MSSQQSKPVILGDEMSRYIHIVAGLIVMGMSLNDASKRALEIVRTQ